MANLNVSFKETESIVDNPSYTSLVQKKPQIISTLSSSQRVRKETQSYPPFSSQNSPKKRKADSSPNSPPIRRDFDTQFYAGPVSLNVQANTEIDVEQFINQLTVALHQQLEQYFQNISNDHLDSESAIPNLSINEIDIKSQSALLALMNPAFRIHNDKVMVSILEKLVHLADQNKGVTFIWIKGYANIEGNEKADKLAKEAVSCDQEIAIMAEGKEHALAIGKTSMSTEEISNINKGIGVENCHYLNDGLWQMKPVK
nr:unnamed protein product [Callosobruchus analis]